MTFSEIASAKEKLANLKEQAAKLEREIRQAELNAEMNRIESLKMKNYGLINGLEEVLGKDDKATQQVIKSLQERNEKLEEEWQVVYKEYFYL